MLNLRFQYHPLFTIKILHNFYQNQTSNELELSPTPGTAQLIDQMRFMLKTKDQALYLIFDANRSDALVHFLNGPEPIKFSFWLYSSNDYFINFTDLPTEASSSILYFDNSNPTVENDEQQFLHEGEFVTPSHLHPVRPATFGHLPATENVKMEIVDRHDQVIQSGITDTGLKFPIDLTRAGAGQYRILENGEETFRFVYPGKSMARNPLALIEVELTEEIKEEITGKIQNQEAAPVFHYSIRFQTRSTYWKYFITSKYLNGLDQVKILSPDGDISFTGPEEVTLVNGDRAYSFLSEKELPLLEFPQHTFQLRKTNGQGETGSRTLLDRLPVPSIQSIIPESRSDSSKIYSEIFVYI